MTIFNIFTLFGGLAFFLFGMHTMSNGLEKIAGGKLEKILRKMTDKPLKALLLGIAITATIQSSSAVTVMLVGLVNSGIMQLGQTIGVIMGSNIGTTLTAWILSLAGIESDNFFIKLLNPSAFSPLLALAGILLIMLAKKSRTKDIGSCLMGFSVLMFGMELMSDSVSPLAEMEGFGEIMLMFNNPLFGLAVGIVLTGIVQSSAATVGILQALSMTGSVTYGMAIPIIMGQNIGTCVTALISSIGVSKNAKRVAFIHVSFNVIGTAVFLSLFYGLNAIFKFAFVDTALRPHDIAMIHSIFNVATSLLLLPFSSLLEKLAAKAVRDKGDKSEKTFIDERLLLTPTLAVSECRNHTVEMAKIAREAFTESIKLLGGYDRKAADRITELEQSLDDYEDKLGTFLVKISGLELTDEDANIVSTLLHTIGDFERIGDHALNLVKVAQEISDKGISFSDEAKNELMTATKAISEILDITVTAFCDNDAEAALRVEPLEQVIDNLLAEIKDRHIARLTGGSCTIELGFVLADILTNYERVSDHCSNIAVCIIQIGHSVFDTHEYLNEYKNAGGKEFTAAYDGFKKKYALPGKA